jgi:glycosyltransferase involved in cell wall biosynthesis
LLLISDLDDVKIASELENTYVINFKKKGYLRIFKETHLIFKKYDGLLLHIIHPKLIPSLVLFRGKNLLFQHGMIFDNKNFLKRNANKLVYIILPILLNAKVVCSTEFAKKKMARRGIILPNSLIKIIPFGVELPSKRLDQSEYSNNDTIRIGMAGYFAPQKRFNLVLEFIINIAGYGPEEDNLKRVAFEIKKNRAKVNFLGWIENMDSFYSRIDAFILPSAGESFGLVIAEALVRGIPVIALADMGGSIFLINHLCNGFIVKDRNGLVELWRDLAQNPEILNKQRENILKMDFSLLDIKLTRKKLEGLFLPSF